MKLTKLANDRYEIKDDYTRFEGDWESVFYRLQEDFEVPLVEIKLAVNWLASTGHNTAHFGVNHTVTHTSNAQLVQACLTQLEAIREATSRFHESYKRNRDSKETHLAADAVKSLWIALNIDGIQALLEDKYEVKSMR